MTKIERKSVICLMAIVAAMVKKIVDMIGVCGVHPWLDRRGGFTWTYLPGVQLMAWKFMELFGEDTNYEYLTDSDGDMTIITEVNGVIFHAPISGMDQIHNGRLV